MFAYTCFSILNMWFCRTSYPAVFDHEVLAAWGFLNVKSVVVWGAPYPHLVNTECQQQVPLDVK